MSRSYTTLLSGGGSSSLRLGGSRSSPGEGFDLVMLLKSHGIAEGPTGSH
jgi:hypothetical protein